MSERINDGGPAFPVAEERWIDPMHPHKGVTNFDGMTLRDYFAAKAMQGDWAVQGAEQGEWLNSVAQQSLEARAQLFYRMADAMLAAREVKS